MESVDHAARWLENDFSIHPRSELRQSPKLPQMINEVALCHVDRFCTGMEDLVKDDIQLKSRMTHDLGDFLSGVLCLPPGLLVRLNRIIRGSAFVDASDGEEQLLEGFCWPVFLSVEKQSPQLSFTPFSTYVLLAFARVIEAISLANFGQPVPEELIREIKSLLQYPLKCAELVMRPQNVEGRLPCLPSAGDMLVIRAIVDTWPLNNVKRLLLSYPPEAYCSKSFWMGWRRRRYTYFSADHYKFDSFIRYISPLALIQSRIRLSLRDEAIDSLMTTLSRLLSLFQRVDFLTEAMESPKPDNSAARILSLFSKTSSWCDSQRLAWSYVQKANAESLPAVSKLLKSDDTEDVLFGLEIFTDLLGYRHLRKTADNESIAVDLHNRYGDAFAKVLADAVWVLGRPMPQEHPLCSEWQAARRLTDKFLDRCLLGENALLLLGRTLLHILFDHEPSNVRASHSFPSLADYAADCPQLETVLRKWRCAVESYIDGNEQLHSLESEFTNLEDQGGNVAKDVRLLFQLEQVKRAYLQNV